LVLAVKLDGIAGSFFAYCCVSFFIGFIFLLFKPQYISKELASSIEILIIYFESRAFPCAKSVHG
jgi:hypothetical protein